MIHIEFDDTRKNYMSSISFTIELIKAVDDNRFIREVSEYLKVYCHNMEKAEAERKYFESNSVM